jgi:hypothetical protein
VIRVTGFVHLDADARDEVAAVLDAAREHVDVLSLEVAPPKPRSVGAGQLMVLAAFHDDDACDAAAAHPYVREVVGDVLTRRASHVEAVRYRVRECGVREPGLEHGIQRTLLFHVDENADPEAVASFERDLAAMPRYIDAIRNWALHRVDAVWGCTGKPWTHVWEQEYETLDGLTNDYMNHAYHWSWVDTWFDPQAPNHIVDTTLVHAMCDLDRSILALADKQLLAE